MSHKDLKKKDQLEFDGIMNIARISTEMRGSNVIIAVYNFLTFLLTRNPAQLYYGFEKYD